MQKHFWNFDTWYFKNICPIDTQSTQFICYSMRKSEKKSRQFQDIAMHRLYNPFELTRQRPSVQRTMLGKQFHQRHFRQHNKIAKKWPQRSGNSFWKNKMWNIRYRAKRFHVMICKYWAKSKLFYTKWVLLIRLY